MLSDSHLTRTAMTRTASDDSVSPGGATSPVTIGSVVMTRRDQLRSAMVKRVSPGMVSGVTAGDWARLLIENRFRIEPAHWPRALATVAASGVTSAFGVAESLAYGRRIAAVEVPPPLFVLGHWRSGTTHLHNLLALDERFASPTFSEVTIPHTFLTGQWLLNAFLWFLLPPTRFGIDNIPMSADAPSEEEFALAQMTFQSPYVGWAFPQRADWYGRYVSFRNVPEPQVAQWKRALLTFVKKLTYRHNRPIILKSPANTARIRLLLDIFPDARFVHIHRDPYTVYQSTRHLHVSCTKTFGFQTLDESTLQERILTQYADLYDAFLDDRGLIPAGHFTELSYQDLESDPAGQIERIYRDLSLPDFAAVRDDVDKYLAATKSYRKNRHVDLPDDLRRQIAGRWQRTFEEWSYPV